MDAIVYSLPVPRKTRETKPIPGWFPQLDVDIFRFILEEQTRAGATGDLAEMGAYMGKSAVVIGSYQQPHEIFTVIDLFEDSGVDVANECENKEQYGGLSQRAFEENYLRFHAKLPVVVKGASGTLRRFAADGGHRFVHIDASHLYKLARLDIETARALLRPDGIVVLDDFQSMHTPGVAAATWEAVSAGLNPIVITPQKMYATWADTGWWQHNLSQWLRTTGYLQETQEVAGRPLIRAWTPAPLPSRSRRLIDGVLSVVPARRS